MGRPIERAVGIAAILSLSILMACGEVHQPLSALEGEISYGSAVSTAMAGYSLTGDVLPLHDPSILRQGNTYYVFTTDVIGLPPGNYLPIRCSRNESNWTPCGNVFRQIPAWVRAKVPGIVGLWAPDISYFNGLYHLYYAGSTLGAQRSVIGLATNATLDRSDPSYKWVDRGEVLESKPGDDYNAIDPNISIDATGRIWISYGSYWTGIKQMQIDPTTGMVVVDSARTSLAMRPGVVHDPIEGASMVHHGNFYYLFVSIDYCCNADIGTDNYKEAVGRSSSPQGPFVDEDGTPMMDGGGTVLLEAQGDWNAPGGATAYIDSQTGESLLVFHALNMSQGGAMYLWVKQMSWQNDWPVLVDPRISQ